jgi:hypothetical protein
MGTPEEIGIDTLEARLRAEVQVVTAWSPRRVCALERIVDRAAERGYYLRPNSYRE